MDENSSQSQPPVASGAGNKFSISKLPAVPIIVGLFVMIVIMAVAGYLLFPKKPNAEVAKHVISGNAALKNGDYDKAQDDFEKALAIEEDAAAAQIGLINAHSLEGNQSGTEKQQLEDSQGTIEQALRDHPNDPDVLMAAGYAYEGAGEYEKALAFYKKATEVAPNSSQAWFHLGHVSQFLGNAADSRNYYNKSYELDPKNPSVNMVRGNTFFSQQKLDEAFESYKVAANNSTTSEGLKAEALAGAATVLMNRDNFAYIVQADAIAKQAVEADPNFAPALGIYGFTRYLAGDNVKALEYLGKATEANPRISKNHNYLGLINRASNNLPTAVENFTTAIEVVDSDNTIFTPEARTFNKAAYSFELAKTYALMGNNAEALAALVSAVAIDPRVKERISAEAEFTDTFAGIEGDPQFQALIN